MRFLDIKPNDVLNGKGVMVSVWLSGCHHHCKDCFQPETWSFKAGEEFTNDHLKYVLELLDKNGIKRDLSILGGDPLAPENIQGTIGLCSYIKLARPETTIYVWTGYTYEQLMERYPKECFDKIDILIDGKCDVEQKDLTLLLRGSRNQRIIDVKKSKKDYVVEFTI